MFIIIKEGDTYSKIAREFSLDLGDVIRYNDYPGKEELFEGNVFYIKPKSNKGSKPYHTVSEGETMKSISQLHGIDLQSLCEKNGINLYGLPPKPGTLLYLQTKKPDK